jgi:hypothetical protein
LHFLETLFIMSDVTHNAISAVLRDHLVPVVTCKTIKSLKNLKRFPYKERTDWFREFIWTKAIKLGQTKPAPRQYGIPREFDLLELEAGDFNALLSLDEIFFKALKQLETRGISLEWRTIHQTGIEDFSVGVGTSSWGGLRERLFEVYWHLMNNFSAEKHVLCEDCCLLGDHWNAEWWKRYRSSLFPGEDRWSCSEVCLFLYWEEYHGIPFGGEDGPTELPSAIACQEYLDKLSSEQLVVMRVFLMVLTLGVFARSTDEGKDLDPEFWCNQLLRGINMV